MQQQLSSPKGASTVVTTIVAVLLACNSAGAVPYEFHESTMSNLPGASDAAINSAGHIIVAASDNARIEVRHRHGRLLKSWGLRGYNDGAFITPCGVAIDSEGRVYVVDSGRHRVQRFSASGNYETGWGELGSGGAQLRHPLAIAVHNKRVYVADYGNHRVQIYDVQGRHRGSLKGPETARLQFPSAIAVAEDGTVFVTELHDHRVTALHSDGTVAARWGEWGAHPGFFGSPRGIAVLGEEVFVCDRDHHRIQVFSRSGEYRRQWGRHQSAPGEAEGALHYPNSLAVAADGSFAVVCEPFEDRCQVFVAEGSLDAASFRQRMLEDAHYGPRVVASGNRLIIVEAETHTLQIYDTSRTTPILISTAGGYGSKFGQFRSPSGLALIGNRLLATEAGGVRIQGFDLASQEKLRFDPFLARFAQSLDLARVPALQDQPDSRPMAIATITLDTAGRMYVLDALSGQILVVSPTGLLLHRWGGESTRDRRFAAPTDVHFCSQANRLYVVDSGNQRIMILDTAGKVCGRLRGTEPDWQKPWGITSDSDGSVYVTDAGSHRVHKFSEQGIPLGSWGGPGIGPVQFRKPKGIAVAETTGAPVGDQKQPAITRRVFVLDYGNHRGQILTDTGKFLGAFGPQAYARPALRGAKSAQGQQ